MEQNNSVNKFDYYLTNFNQFHKEAVKSEEFRKQLNYLKNSLQKKEYELASISSLYQELKKINEKLRQECENLNEKNNILFNDRSSLERKYEDEIENIEKKYKNKINEYEMQIKNYSLNIDSNKTKIENENKNEDEEKYIKDKEILEKNQIIEQLKNENELLDEKYQNEKESLLKDMNTLKNLHKTETNDLLQRIEFLKVKNTNIGNNLENEHFLHLKNELENAKIQINLLNNEIYKIKRENESLIKENNELKINNIIFGDKLKLEEKKYEFEFKKLNINIENLKYENISLKKEISQNESKIKDYYIEKKNFKNEISNKELECQQLQNEINVLNSLLKTHQDEFDINLNENYKIQNEIMIKGRNKEEKYKKEIEDLNIKLNQNINREDYEEIINKKDEEIIKLKEKIKEIKNDALVDAKLIKQYNDVIKKKDFYKKQCKQANEKIGKMIEKLNSEQIKEFQNLFNTEKNNNIFEISQSGAV